MQEEPKISSYLIDYKTNEKGFFSSAHSHQHYEVFFFEKGRATHFIDFEAYPITDNSYFLVSYNQIHYIEASPFTHNLGYALSFSKSYFDFLEKDLKDLFCPFSLKPAYYLNQENQAFITNLFQQIQIELNAALPKSNNLVLQYLKIILTHLYRLRPENEDKNAVVSHSNLLFSQFLNELEIYFQQKKTVQEYAILLHTNARQLNRICQKACQQSALAIIHNRLNLEAKRLLFYSENPIKEICYQIGFEDPAHFSNFFKRMNKESPESFRQRMSDIFN